MCFGCEKKLTKFSVFFALRTGKKLTFLKLKLRRERAVGQRSNFNTYPYILEKFSNFENFIVLKAICYRFERLLWLQTGVRMTVDKYWNCCFRLWANHVRYMR